MTCSVTPKIHSSLWVIARCLWTECKLSAAVLHLIITWSNTSRALYLICCQQSFSLQNFLQVFFTPLTRPKNNLKIQIKKKKLFSLFKLNSSLRSVQYLKEELSNMHVINNYFFGYKLGDRNLRNSTFLAWTREYRVRLLVPHIWTYSDENYKLNLLLVLCHAAGLSQRRHFWLVNYWKSGQRRRDNNR